MRSQALYAVGEYEECRKDCKRGIQWFNQHATTSLSFRKKLWSVVVLECETHIAMGDFGPAYAILMEGLGVFGETSPSKNPAAEKDGDVKCERTDEERFDRLVDSDVKSVRRRCEKAMKSGGDVRQASNESFRGPLRQPFGPASISGASLSELKSSLAARRRSKYAQAKQFVHPALKIVDEPGGLTGKCYEATSDIRCGKFAMSLSLSFFVS
jgi:hypothetical protein